MSEMFSSQMVRCVRVVIFMHMFSVNEANAKQSWLQSVQCGTTSKNITMMTKGNLFFTKRIPLVIGHRGNPMVYQENSLAGYKSLLDLNVDGFETDIFLTKDKKLVLFHDVKTLVGDNGILTYSLHVKTELMADYYLIFTPKP